MTPRFHLGRLEVKKWLPHGQPSSKVNFKACILLSDMINLITHILKNYFFNLWQYRLSIKSMQRCELNHHNMTFGGKSLNKSEALKSSIYDSCSNSISFLPHISSKRNISAMYYKTKAWQKLLSWVILGTFLKGRHQGTFDKKGVSMSLMPQSKSVVFRYANTKINTWKIPIWS